MTSTLFERLHKHDPQLILLRSSLDHASCNESKIMGGFRCEGGCVLNCESQSMRVKLPSFQTTLRQESAKSNDSISASTSDADKVCISLNARSLRDL